MILRTFLLFFLCWFHIGFCQNEKVISPILKSNIPSEEKIKTVDSIVALYDIQNKHTLLNSLYNVYSTWLYEHKNYTSAIEILRASIENQRNLPITDTLLWQHRLYYLGLSYRKTGQYDNSIAVFQHPIIRYGNTPKTARSYSELGRNYRAIGDYYKAINYYQLGALLLAKHGNNKSLSTNYFNTSLAFILLKTPEGHQKSLHYLLKADSLSNRISTKNSLSYNIKIGLGNSYNQFKNLDIPKAYSYYKEALDIAIKLNNSFKIFKVYNELGNLLNTSDPDKGIMYLEKAILYTENDALRYFYIEFNLGTCYLTKGLYDQSISSYLKAISYIIEINSKISEPILNLSTFYNVKNKTSLLNALRYLANAYHQKYNATSDKKALNKAITTYTIADELLDIIRIESTELQSKLYWRKQSAELYGRAIKACFLANNKDKAFYFMEKSKALLLTEELKNVQLKKNNTLPAYLIKKETKLKKNIYTLEKQKQADPNIDSIAIELLNKQDQLITLQDSIKNEFADFEVINTSNTIVNLKEVQESIDMDQVVVTYHISSYDDTGLITKDNNYKAVVNGSKYGTATKNSSYGMMITQNDIQFFELGNPDRLKKQVVELSKKMTMPLKSDAEIANYIELSHQVYQNLFPSEKIRNTIKNKKMLVIPNAYLNYISFEALVTTNTSKNPTYLIEDIQINYAYSNSFLKAINSYIDHSPEITFLGIAPKQFEHQKLAPLSTSDEEIKAIGTYFSGKQYIQQEATKENFLNALSNYSIIHLATHADAQDSISPWIAFRKNKLLLEELYFANNKAKMVVLSGCKTQLGKQEIGEGVMSLARGFFHSGAESVVSSLWDVQDLSTSYIMNQFYKNLSDNQTKSEALRNAKLNYLDTHMLSDVSPSYWASFVLLGNTDPLFKEQISVWWWLGILPVFLLFFLVYRKLAKK